MSITCLKLSKIAKFSNFSILMYILTISNQTNHIKIDLFMYYNNAVSDKYLNDSDSYNDESDCRSDDYNNMSSIMSQIVKKFSAFQPVLLRLH